MSKDQIVIARLWSKYTGLVPPNAGVIGSLEGGSFQSLCVYLSKSSSLENHFSIKYGMEDFYLSKSKSVHALGAVFRLAKLLKKKKVDILHCYGEQAAFYGFVACKFNKETKIIYQTNPMELARDRTGLLASLALKGYDGIIVSGEKDAKKISKSGIDAEKIFQIETTIDYHRFSACEVNKEQARDILNLPNDALIYGNVGSLGTDRKNREVVQAFAKVKQKLSNSHLVFIGEGSRSEQLKELARTSEVGDAIHFFGRREDIDKCLRAFDIFVSSKIVYDGLPRPVLEAMASGIPCIGPAEGGLEKLFKDNRFGVAVEGLDVESLADAMIKLATAPHNEVLDMVNSAVSEVERNYDHTIAVKKLRELYQCLR